MTSTEKQAETKRLLEQAHEVLEDLTYQPRVRFEMQEWLLDRLRDGKLFAFAYSLDGDGVPGEEPVEVPPYMFTTKYAKWGSSSLKGLGREFVEVRVLRPQQIKTRRNASRPTITKPIPRRPGRPTHRSLIDVAIASLRAEGLDFSTNTGRENGNIVRMRISQDTGRSIDDIVQGFGDETIRRRIEAYRSQNTSGH